MFSFPFLSLRLISVFYYSTTTVPICHAVYTGKKMRAMWVFLDHRYIQKLSDELVASTR